MTEQVQGTHAPIVDLPVQIQTALARIMGCDGGGLGELTYRERSLLARFVRNVSLRNPHDSIRVAVSTLATALHTSEKTIQRTCASLRAKGWITRDQIKKRDGMEIADTWLTPRTLDLLGLVARKPSRAASDNMADASCISTMSEDSQQETGSFEKKTGTIPEDLKLLEQIGMKPGAVFKLMGEARKMGHRLGHIVRAAAPLIRAATYPFGYLLKLIRHERDWEHYTCAAVKQEQQAAQVEEEATQNSAVRAVIEAALPLGAMLTNAAGKLVWLMRYGAVYACPAADLVKPESARGYARVTDLAKMADAIQAGKLFRLAQVA